MSYYKFLTSNLPIRLLDIPATLCSNGGVCFVDPREGAIGWDFHIISHTWSKGVRDLSDAVGRDITPSSSAYRGSSYSQLFRRKDFSREPAYVELLKFLALLSHDQVVRVWFDALCINQKDNEEKSKEIGFMGSYYAHSRGCYVLSHGVGQGYHLWSSSQGRASSSLAADRLPRWFTRAWTFQEFLYPTQLYFVVAPSIWTIRLLNRCIAAQGSMIRGFCKCCLLPLHVYEENSTAPSSILYKSCGLTSIMMPVDSLLSQEGDIGVMEGAGGDQCCICGTSSLIRSIPDQKNLYFVERDAYIFVASLERWMPPPGCYYLLPSVPFVSIDYARLIGLYKVHQNGCAITYSQIVEQISFRACSVPEDRILCILGILGVDGSQQLRTGKPLKTQFVEVAKVCKADTLVGLSMVEYYGNHTQHMSWAPWLTGHSSTKKKLQLTGSMQVEAEVLGVSKRGCLRLESTVLHGWFKLGVPIFTASNVFAEINQNETKRGSGLVSLRISCDSEDGNTSQIGAAQVPLLRFTDLRREALQFPMWMIVVGHTIDSAHNTRNMITMVCLGKDKSKGGGRDKVVLHKIGFVIFPAKLANTLLSMCGCRRKCVLGGFGRILNDYVCWT